MLLCVVGLGFFSASNFRTTPAPKITPTPSPDNLIAAAESPDAYLVEVIFCEDTLPLARPEVAAHFKKAIEHFDHPSIWKLRKSAKKQIGQMTPILEKYGVPTDFVYVPLVESGMNPAVVSARGAAGYWQFMPETARGLGLVVNQEVDERLDLVKSTRAAAKYLKWLYSELGDWTLVAAAFNAGPNKIIRRMDQQKTSDYYSLRLNPETTRYVFRLVAVKEWINHPQRCREWTQSDVLVRVNSLNEAPRSNARAES